MFFTIRNILIGLFLVISLSLAGLVGNGMWTSFKKFHDYSEVAELASLDKQLFDALLAFRAERGHSASALAVDLSRATGSITTARAARQRVDVAVNAFLEQSASLDHAALQEGVARVKTAYQRFVDLRTRIDSNLTLPLDRREKGIDKTVLALGTELLTAKEQESTDLEGHTRSLDETLTGIIQLRANAWAARAVAGSATVMLNTVVADQRSLTSQEIQQLGNLDATALFAWKITGDLIAHESTPASLKTAYAAAEMPISRAISPLAGPASSTISQTDARRPSPSILGAPPSPRISTSSRKSRPTPLLFWMPMPRQERPKPLRMHSFISRSSWRHFWPASAA